MGPHQIVFPRYCLGYQLLRPTPHKGYCKAGKGAEGGNQNNQGAGATLLYGNASRFGPF